MCYLAKILTLNSRMGMLIGLSLLKFMLCIPQAAHFNNIAVQGIRPRLNYFNQSFQTDKMENGSDEQISYLIK